MTEQVDRRADLTRHQILQAASRQFARKPYSLVSLDDILADAAVTKGALYFHFRSKRALASAIVDHRVAIAQRATEVALARNLSGLETLIDISYRLAVDDTGDEMTRAGLNLVESIGRAEGLGRRVVDAWVHAYTEIARRARAQGDLAEDSDPQTVARTLVAAYIGLRQTSDLNDRRRFVTDLELSWTLALPGFANPERLGYLTQFVRRRTGLTIKKSAPVAPGLDSATGTGVI